MSETYALDVRQRIFRNRFEEYALSRVYVAAPELDGSSLTLREVCQLVSLDDEPFPRYFDDYLVRNFRREALANLEQPIRYRGVARLLGRRLDFVRARSGLSIQQRKL